MTSGPSGKISLAHSLKVGLKDSPHKLGELLVKAGFLNQAQFDQCARLSLGGSVAQLGQMLIMSGLITHDQLNAVLDAQACLRDRQMDQALAVKGLKISKTHNISFRQAMQELEFADTVNARKSNRVGELLVAAEIITREQCQQALNKNLSTGLPLGRILVLSRLVSEQILLATLNAQIFIRDGKLTREQAVAALKAAHDRQVPLDQPLTESGMVRPESQRVRLGELLVKAGAITEAELIDAIETGLTQALPIGQVLVNSALVHERIVNSAVELQQFVADGMLQAEQAVDALKSISSQGHYGLSMDRPREQEREAQPAHEVRKNGITKVAGEFEKPVALPAVVPQLTDMDQIQFSSIKSRSIYFYKYCQKAETDQVGSITFDQFLTFTRVAAPDHLLKAREMCTGTDVSMTKALCILRAVPNDLMDLTRLSYELLLNGKLSFEKCVYAIEYVRESLRTADQDLEEVLEKLGQDSGIWQLLLFYRKP
jgi:hypothetical protein